MIARDRVEYPVSRLCRLFGVSASGYYAWKGREPGPRSRANSELVKAMRKIHDEVKGRYGSPRMYAELLDRGYQCGRHRVARLMQAHGLVAKQRKKRPGSRFHGERGKAPNLLNRQFTVARANQVWAADITYVRTAEGFVYLAVVVDLYSRRVIGWAMRSRLGADLVESALCQAIGNRQPGGDILHHSDQDGLYACAAYYELLTQHDFVISNSRRGNCYDNACVESFFARLKTECLPPTRFMTREQAEMAIFAYIEVFYNRVRRHSTLNYLSPADFELSNHQP